MIVVHVPSFRVVSETEVIVGTGLWEAHPAEHLALMEWCRFHGMDPKQMPTPQVIVRNLVDRCVEHDVFVLGVDGIKVIEGGAADDPRDWRFVRRRVRAQGETPPLPFPDVILAHLHQEQP